MLPMRNQPQNKSLRRLKVKCWIKIFQANGQGKKAGVAILISDKIDFKKRTMKRDPEGYFITLKGRIHQKDINIVNIYAPNIGEPKYMKKILEYLKKDIQSKTIIVRDFNTPLSKMNRSSKQNINKDIVILNKALDEMDFTDIHIELFNTKKQNTHSFQMHMEHFQR